MARSSGFASLHITIWEALRQNSTVMGVALRLSHTSLKQNKNQNHTVKELKHCKFYCASSVLGWNTGGSWTGSGALFYSVNRKLYETCVSLLSSKNMAEKLFLYLYWDLPELLLFETTSLENSSCTFQLEFVCLVYEHLALIW